MNPNFIEVCSGCGGLSSGFIKAGFTPLFLNDNDKICCKTLELNHPNANVVCEDMTKLQLNEFVGKVDVLMGGVPCQSFSQAGERKGLEDKRGNLLLEFIKLILQLRPKVWLIENVKGLLTHNKGKTFEHVLNVFKDTFGTNYKVQYKLLNAVNYNVPQKRERVFIVGVAGYVENSFKFPEKETGVKVLRAVLEDCPKSEGVKYSPAKYEIMRQIPEGGCWINLPENLQRSYLGKSFESGGGKRGIARRLSMDEPSLTLTTSPCQKQTERCHPKETRPLTVREYARIQTFPDSYEFCGTVTQKYKQIGNAVPAKLAYRIAQSILAVLK